ncbi:MAG TPA: tRNA 2-thiouridine(34) synthase MnmA [Candidatus Paceibacterota bacterium]
MKVFVGLSGGVDSATSAALLQQQGHDVTGVFIRIAIDGYPCTAGEDKLDAMRVAAHLQIPFVEIDLSEQYKQKVFDESVKAFARGRTPNPDTLCNKEIKFGLFFNWCMSHGADLIATGHYAQVRDGLLYKGTDPEKDQSYFLWAVPQAQLAKTIFPIGHLHKTEVRKLAATFGLPNAARKDSQGLCFLGPVSIDDMLSKELAPTPGNVVDEAGAVVGKHEGAVRYTLGQRHGFALFAHSPTTPPHYVVGKNIKHNTITVSINKFPQHATTTEITLTDTNAIGPHKSGTYLARYRYRQELIPAELRDGKILLQQPHYVPVGQSLVLYDGERCLGGGSVDTATLKH